MSSIKKWQTYFIIKLGQIEIFGMKVDKIGKTIVNKNVRDFIDVTSPEISKRNQNN